MAESEAPAPVASLPPHALCSAHSKRTGNPCTKTAVLGATVCYYHGGAAPQVKAKAMERIMAMVDPALYHMGIIIEEGDTDAVRLAAIRDVLDRAGYGATQKTSVEVLTKRLVGVDVEEI